MRRSRVCLVPLALLALLLIHSQSVLADERPPGSMLGVDLSAFGAANDEPIVAQPSTPSMQDLARSAPTIAFFALISVAPLAVLMTTAFIRIQVVLLLLRQAIGSPQVPGNQVLTALSVLLTAIVMVPTAQTVYEGSVRPFAEGRLSAGEAWESAAIPIKEFMLEQIYKTKHERYLTELNDLASPESASERLADGMDLPLRVVAPAFVISELTTAFWVGFMIYLPFLAIDLVVSVILAATGLVMVPPSQVTVPLKLALFVVADGWWLMADGLLRTFALGQG
jgi:flagellar biosynthesis protein FliP